MSLSWTVANPYDDGLTFIKVSPFLYSLGFMSGFVVRLKTGCSIEPMSPLIAASTMSQTKKSCCGCLLGKSGSRIDIMVASLWDSNGTSHTLTPAYIHSRQMVHHTPIIGTSHTKKWYITHQTCLNIVLHQLLISRFQRRNSYSNYINNRTKQCRLAVYASGAKWGYRLVT